MPEGGDWPEPRLSAGPPKRTSIGEIHDAKDRVRLEVGVYWIALLGFLALAALGLPVLTILLALATLYALIRAFHANESSILSPSLMFSGVLCTLGTLGFLTTSALEASGDIPQELRVSGLDQRTDALQLYLLASLFTLVGASLGRRGRIPRVGASQFAALSDLLRTPNVALSIATSVLIFNLSVRPIGDLWVRRGYIIPTEIGGILTYLQIPAAVLLGLAVYRSPWHAKVLSVLLLGGLVGFSFSLSSRMMPLLFLMFFIGLAFGFNRARTVLLLTGLAVALLLIPVPLYMRGLSEQGLYPNLMALPDVTFFSSDAYIATFSNFISSFNVVALTAFRADPIPWSSFWESLNPLPGALFSAPQGPALRLGSAVPYAALGEVANHGLWLVPFFFAVVGWTFGLTEAATGRLISAERAIYVAVAPTGIALLAAVLFAQYNLRTASRMIYLNLALALVMSILAGRGGGSESANSAERPG